MNIPPEALPCNREQGELRFYETLALGCDLVVGNGYVLAASLYQAMKKAGETVRVKRRGHPHCGFQSHCVYITNRYDTHPVALTNELDEARDCVFLLKRDGKQAHYITWSNPY